ncbi:MAG: NADP(H)-dependent aldo-keto reductase [Gammaproteobacteria bacterium]|nr:NADP(H)-dependent aldo-keto reductase [Gammaproteobacteria bacterium]
MKYRRLGKTDVKVSLICLGTMTWGEQNTQDQAFEQMDYALEQGVNFFDTAELYSIPPNAATYGSTETIIGNWLKARGKREQIVLASKIAGPGPGWVDHIRKGQSRFDRGNIESAVNDSLKRLQTDYIDLYQLHWPERKTNFFGHLGYQNAEPDDFTPMEDTLQALAAEVEKGKIRYIGLSNETPWGVMRFIETAERLGLPRIVSVQNPYNLLNRSYEVGLAEVSQRESAGLLAYSPLGFGVLSGKYVNDARPEGARITRWPDYKRYMTEQAVAATEEYVALAHAHGLSPAQMALAYINSRPFVTANIIGATTMDQLKMNIASIDLKLDDTVMGAIEEIHTRYPNPSP